MTALTLSGNFTNPYDDEEDSGESWGYSIYVNGCLNDYQIGGFSSANDAIDSAEELASGYYGYGDESIVWDEGRLYGTITSERMDVDRFSQVRHRVHVEFGEWGEE